MDTPSLVFQFVDEEGNQDPKVFRNPVEIIETSDIREVPTAFAQAEERLDHGFYIAGYVSYEAAPAFDHALSVHTHQEWPLVWFGVFEAPERLQTESKQEEFEVSSWEIKGTFSEYQKGIETIKQAIERGDTYQVNYTTRMEASFTGDDYSFYQKLVRNQQSSYSAYLNLGDRRLLSASPELFFRISGRTITTKPMKGTTKRGRSIKEDEVQKQSLLSSDKERSENLMIVDLLRNDLGRIVMPGTVRVPSLFEVETYPTVHQMTSTVKGTLPENFTMFELFQALFPCGSITGAPKIRTMEYIEQLEKSPREVYCGAIGYMTPEKEAVFNVPIRTVMIDQAKGKAVYGTGGGVTWDSTSEGEFEELHTKARLLTEDRPNFALLETMKLEDGRIPLWADHLERVTRSAAYFGYPLKRENILLEVDDVVDAYSEGLFKIRLLVNECGACRVEVHPIDSPPEHVTCVLADEPIDEQNPFLYHKTTHRDMYETHTCADTFSTLLWNTKGELTEFTVANLVVKEDGHLFTPPVSCGLLAGTLREKMIREGVIKEKVLYKKDLHRFEELWMINGLRGWIKVGLVQREK